MADRSAFPIGNLKTNRLNTSRKLLNEAIVEQEKKCKMKYIKEKQKKKIDCIDIREKYCTNKEKYRTRKI